MARLPGATAGRSCPTVPASTRLRSLRLLESADQDVCRPGGASLQHGLLTNGGPVPGTQRRVVAHYRPANDLHPGIPVFAAAVAALRSRRQRTHVEPDILMQALSRCEPSFPAPDILTFAI